MNQWKFGQAHQIGIRHNREHLPCQDHVCIQKNGFMIAGAVCDGLGSLRNSGVAAEIASELTVQWFQNNRNLQNFTDAAIHTHVSNELIPSIQSEIYEAARDRQMDPATMDCNLAFICIYPSRNIAVIGRIGDGAVCILSKNSRVNTSFSDSANGTDTVMHGSWVQKLDVEIVHLEDVTAFILTTDGLESEIYLKGSDLPRKNAEKYVNLMLNHNADAALKKKLSELNQTNPELDDDLSIAVFSKATSKIQLAKDPTWLCTCGCRNSMLSSFCERCHNDFLDVYEMVDFTDPKIGCKERYFAGLNRSPEKEWALIHSNQNHTVSQATGKYAPSVSEYPKISTGSSSSASPAQRKTRTGLNSSAKSTQAKTPTDQNSFASPTQHKARTGPNSSVRSAQLETSAGQSPFASPAQHKPRTDPSSSASSTRSKTPAGRASYTGSEQTRAPAQPNPESPIDSTVMADIISSQNDNVMKQYEAANDKIVHDYKKASYQAAQQVDPKTIEKNLKNARKMASRKMSDKTKYLLIGFVSGVGCSVLAHLILTLL